jgi:hypothetical protein
MEYFLIIAAVAEPAGNYHKIGGNNQTFLNMDNFLALHMRVKI